MPLKDVAAMLGEYSWARDVQHIHSRCRDRATLMDVCVDMCIDMRVDISSAHGWRAFVETVPTITGMSIYMSIHMSIHMSKHMPRPRNPILH